ncbi:MAG: stage II sporulation protein E [Cellulosilyticaceae bacterium]
MNNAITKEKSVRELFKAIRWSDVWLCIFAFIFGRIGVAGEYYTLVIAYVGSLYLGKELGKWSSLFAILGLVSLTIFDTTTVKYICMIMFVVLGRKGLQYSKKKLNERNQAFIVGISIIIANLLELIIIGFNLFAFLIGILEGMVGAGLVIVLNYGVKVIRENRKTCLTTKETISMTLIFAGILAGMVDIYVEVPMFIEIYLRDILTFIVLIAVAYLGGVNVGVTISLVVSSVLILIGYIPVEFASIYGITVLFAGLFNPMGRIGVVLGGFLGNILGFAVFNERMMDMPLIGAYIVAGIVTLIFPEKYFGLANWFGYKEEEESELLHIQRVQKIITDRLSHFVEAFNKLSDTFKNIECKKLGFTDKEIKYIIEDTAEKFCMNCSMCKFCWEQDIVRTYNMAHQMVLKGEKNGAITRGDIPDKFRQDCLNAENFAYMLNFKLDLHKQDIMWSNRLVESRAIVGEQLKAVANSIYSLVQAVEEEVRFNKEEERLLTEALHAEGIRVKDLMVVENKNKKQWVEIYTNYCRKKIDIPQKILGQVEEVLGIETTIDKHECTETGCYFKLVIKEKFGITAAATARAKEKVSGDVYSFMELDNGQYLLALADGMGSGEIAKRESTATIELLEEFMDSGFKKDLAVKLINSALVLKSTEETFSTMDITLIDTHTGVAEFLKAGAATSFILRGKDVLTIRSATFPIGILKEVDLEVQKLQLKHGDIIVMVTDGILAAKDDVLGKEDTFKHFIQEAGAGEPKYIAEYLMQKSCDLLGIENKDDMTIVVAKVWQKI